MITLTIIYDNDDDYCDDAADNSDNIIYSPHIVSSKVIDQERKRLLPSCSSLNLFRTFLFLVTNFNVGEYLVVCKQKQF